MLVPVIGLVQVGAQAMADRYTYLTQIGMYVALAWGAMHVARTGPSCARAVALAASVALVILSAVCVATGVGLQRDSESLWTHAIASTSENYEAHNGLARALARRGQVDAAIAHYQQALAIKPDFVDAHDNLGNALAATGRNNAAITEYGIALVGEPGASVVFGEVARHRLRKPPAYGPATRSTRSTARPTRCSTSGRATPSTTWGGSPASRWSSASSTPMARPAMSRSSSASHVADAGGPRDQQVHHQALRHRHLHPCGGGAGRAPADGRRVRPHPRRARRPRPGDRLHPTEPPPASGPVGIAVADRRRAWNLGPI